MGETTDTTIRRLTGQEFFELDLPDDGHTYELLDGIVVPRGGSLKMPDGGGIHGKVGQRLYLPLASFVLTHQLGDVPIPSTGYLLAQGMVRKPDASFIPNDRCPSPTPPGFYEFSPPLAVEVVSPHDKMSEVDAKVAEYLKHGSTEVWVVNPFSQTVQAWRSDAPARLLQRGDRLECPDLLPGFSLRISDLFANL